MNTAADYVHMGEIAKGLAMNYTPSPAWRGSPFEWIQTMPPAKRGSVGRRLVERWAQQAGFDAESWTSDDKQIYLLINGFRVQVKFSTLWQSGFYRFQQIRDRDFDFCFCLGLSPKSVHAWLIPKDALDAHVIGHLGQHTGSQAQETAWLTVYPSDPPQWLTWFGDDLDHVAQMLAEG
ncbi:hypothetical protein [Marisediminicola sp. LYQ85]|uniref:hypothetical protein n=1 Tax=Marisediminicola sp. LYQ85 TaxID=3391062 RepID=UPI003983D5A4